MKRLPLLFLSAILMGCQSQTAPVNEEIEETYSEKAPEKEASNPEDESADENSKAQAQIAQPVDLKAISEKEAVQAFADRGFDAITIQYQHNEDGSFIDEGIKVADREGEARHPVYHADYTADGTSWDLFMAGDVLTAYKKDSDSNITVSETELITAYDAPSDTFVQISPEDGEIVAQVDQITPEVLAEN